jgi:hypothetical protein
MTTPRRVSIAALAGAVTFIVGMVMAVTVMADYSFGGADPTEAVAFLVDHQAEMYVWYLIPYVGFAVALVPLVLGLDALLRDGSPVRSRVATVWGLIWAAVVMASGTLAFATIETVAELQATDPVRAEIAWSTLTTITTGLSGIELVSGLWLATVSWAALQAGVFPRALSRLGLAVGLAGALTVVPPLEALAAVFGVGIVVWLIWLAFAVRRIPDAVPSLERSHA